MKNEVNGRMNKIAIMALVTFALLVGVADTSAQAKRRKRKPVTAASVVPVAQTTEPQIISRADDFPDNGTQTVQPNQQSKADESGVKTDDSSRSIDDLRRRVKSLESPKKADRDENQKRLLLDLDILTRAEQRADSLRKQLFEMIEKEGTIRTKLDQIENNIRPETIDREVAFAGTLRPEELRNMRKKNLEIERTNLTALLAEVQKTKANIDQNVEKADLLVERFRTKLEKEMDDLLTLDPVKP